MTGPAVATGIPRADCMQISEQLTGLGDLRSRADLVRLLTAFYDRALEDLLLEPVFTSAAMDLAEHLPRIASFWEVTLLGTGSYSGSPMQLHRALVERAGLAPEHFERWLALWDETLSELFGEPTAERARTEAARMAVGMGRSLTQPPTVPLISDRKRP